MKNKILSRGIFIEGLRRLKIFSIIWTAIILLSEAVPPIITALTTNVKSWRCEAVDFDTVFSVIPFICIIAPFFLVMLMFGNFNRRPYSDFAHSLPYTRTCVFFSKIAALYAVFAGLIIISLGVGYAAYSALPAYYIVNITDFLGKLLKYFSAGTFIVSSLTIAVSLTGTVFSNITAAGLVMFFPRFILFVLTETIIENLPFIGGMTSLPILSPSYNTLTGMLVSIFDIFMPGSPAYDTGAIIYTFVISAIYLVIALLLFRKRKSETAEQPAPGRGVQCAIRVLIALTFSVPATVIMVTDEFSDIGFGIVLYLIAIIAYFAYELITTKNLKRLARAVPALLIVLVINVLCGVGVLGISNVVGSYCPTANEVEAVYLDRGSYYFGEETDNSVTVPLKDLKTKSIVCNTLKGNLDAWKDGKYHYYYSSDKYTCRTVIIDSGVMTHSRIIYLTKEQNTALISAMSENEEFRENFMKLREPVPKTVSCSDLDISKGLDEKKLFDTMQKEIDKIGFEDWFAVTDESRINLKFELNEILSSEKNREVRVYYTAKDNNSITSVPVNSALMPETYEYLIKTAYRNNDTEELEKCLDILTDDEALDYAYVNVEVYDGDTHDYFYYDSDRIFLDEMGRETPGVENVSDDTVISLISDALKEKNEPDGEHYMMVTIDITVPVDTAYDDYHAYVILPVPDSFNP